MDFKTTTGYDLRFMAARNGLRINGIYCKDELKGLKPRKGFYVFNLDSASLADDAGDVGTHWTCAVIGKGLNAVVYFDSFGAPPPLEVEDFLRQNRDSYDYNNWVCQDIDSEACGHFVIAYGKAMAQSGATSKRDMLRATDAFISLFPNEDGKKNEVVLSQLNI